MYCGTAIRLRQKTYHKDNSEESNDYSRFLESVNGYRAVIDKFNPACWHQILQYGPRSVLSQ